MITEFKVAGWWRENEAQGAAEYLLSEHGDMGMVVSSCPVQIQAETEEGKVRIVADLDEQQIAKLRDYFENHPKQEMPQWEREKLVAEKAQKDAVKARIAKVTDDTGVTLVGEDVREALRAMVELVGGLERE